MERREGLTAAVPESASYGADGGGSEGEGKRKEGSG